MRAIRDVPIRTKLMLLLVGVVSVALLLACAAFVAYDIRMIESAIHNHMAALADVIGANCTAALDFQVPGSAEEVLRSLRREPSVVFARVYDSQGEPFAQYAAQHTPHVPPPPRRTEAVFVQNRYLHVFKPILQDQQELGTVYLQASRAEIHAQWRRYAWIVTGVLSGSLIVVVLVSLRLQSIISWPILPLVDATQKVAAENDFSIRVEKVSNDELGMLCDAFNLMLGQIQQRDAELGQHRQHLEDLVRQRTNSLQDKTAALERSEERLNLALQFASVGTWNWDVVADAMTWDDYLHALFGLQPGTFPGRLEDFLNLVQPDDRQRVHQAVRHSVERQADLDSEFQVVWDDGSEHDLGVRGKVYKDEAGRPVRMAGVCWDITQRKRVERAVQRQAKQLARLNDELQRSNVELEQFADIASHDLQEPLRKVQAFSDMLVSQYGDALGEEGSDYLTRMRKATTRMKSLINELLNYSRVTRKGQPFMRVDLNEVAQGVLSDLEARIQETGGRVEVGDLPTIEADPTQMRQLLQNLIGNGLKYHREEEPPVVKIAARMLDNGDGTFLVHSSGGQACQLTVEDNGIGFDEKYLDRIFAPFQRLHGRGEYEGTGMGLAVCRKIVERHRGTIAARSQPGQGSTFIVALPLQQTSGK